MASQNAVKVNSTTEAYWTNRSVLNFAGTSQPIAAMLQRTRALVLEAIERGWSGPPFDPFQLAEYLRIEVLPSQDVVEARTISVGSKFRIEYNPNRGINRARYSVAHEIAHTFFPDCADAIRHRKPYHGGQGDLAPSQTPRDFVRDPVMLEFLGLPGVGRLLEADLERALLDS